MPSAPRGLAAAFALAALASTARAEQNVTYALKVEPRPRDAAETFAANGSDPCDALRFTLVRDRTAYLNQGCQFVLKFPKKATIGDVPVDVYSVTLVISSDSDVDDTDAVLLNVDPNDSAVDPIPVYVNTAAVPDGGYLIARVTARTPALSPAYYRVAVRKPGLKPTLAIGGGVSAYSKDGEVRGAFVPTVLLGVGWSYPGAWMNWALPRAIGAVWAPTVFTENDWEGLSQFGGGLTFLDNRLVLGAVRDLEFKRTRLLISVNGGFFQPR